MRRFSTNSLAALLCIMFIGYSIYATVYPPNEPRVSGAWPPSAQSENKENSKKKHENQRRLAKIFEYSSLDRLNEFRTKFGFTSSTIPIRGSVNYEDDIQTIRRCKKRTRQPKNQTSTKRKPKETGEPETFENVVKDHLSVLQDFFDAKVAEEEFKKSFPEPAEFYWLNLLDVPSEVTFREAIAFRDMLDPYRLNMSRLECTSSSLTIGFVKSEFASKNEGLVGVGTVNFPRNFVYLDVLDRIYKRSRVVESITELFGKPFLDVEDRYLKRWRMKWKGRVYEIEIAISSTEENVIIIHGEPSPTNIIFVVRDVTKSVAESLKEAEKTLRKAIKLRSLHSDEKPKILD